MKKITIALLALAVVLAVTPAAMADTFLFTFTTPNNSSILAMGTLTGTNVGGDQWNITSGSIDVGGNATNLVFGSGTLLGGTGSQLLSPSGYFNYDNEVFVPVPSSSRMLTPTACFSRSKEPRSTSLAVSLTAPPSAVPEQIHTRSLSPTVSATLVSSTLLTLQLRSPRLYYCSAPRCLVWLSLCLRRPRHSVRSCSRSQFVPLCHGVGRARRRALFFWCAGQVRRERKDLDAALH